MKYARRIPQTFRNRNTRRYLITDIVCVVLIEWRVPESRFNTLLFYSSGEPEHRNPRELANDIFEASEEKCLYLFYLYSKARNILISYWIFKMNKMYMYKWYWHGSIAMICNGLKQKIHAFFNIDNNTARDKKLYEMRNRGGFKEIIIIIVIRQPSDSRHV